MPVVTTIVAGAIVFRLLLSNNGLIQSFGEFTGPPITPPNWLGSTRYSKWAVVLLTLWKNTGFTMVWVGNDFLWPLVVTTSENMRTIPVRLAAFVGQYSTAWGLLMAGAVIALLPVLVIYILAQKWLVQGITLSGMGGR